MRPDLWVRAAEIRQEWLEIGLSTTPADRPATEEAISSIYARHGRARPAFVWVSSPAGALPHLAGLPTHQTLRSWVTDRRPPGRPPIASDIAAGLSRLRSSMMAAYQEPAPDRRPLQREKGKPWPLLPPDRALDAGLPFHELVRQGVEQALFRTLADGVYHPIRTALATLLPSAQARDMLPVGWYGHQDAAWIAHLDVLRRLRLIPAGAAFETWVSLARSGGWWWPGERQCVVAERPTAIRTEPVPGAWHDERQLHLSGPAVEYRDGWLL
ncbi:DUF6745 domain-containing protein [Actinoplanes sp. NPDC026619]|uniref:DUF6745 domain-containing protein n=1 Tax=Actinoplanes sp. NPDC026619 TaxID=3155798 RepID=UPI003405630B